MELDHPLGHPLDRTLVRMILEHAEGYAWTLQDIGLLGLRLDDVQVHRLHVWGPAYSVGEPPVHDHPFDFVSTVIVGEMTNTRYVEDPDGDEYRRMRYSPADEATRRADTVRLSGVATTFTEGQQYSQHAHELHDSRQLPGTVTVIRRSRVEVPELTVCTLGDVPWVSGRSRPATRAEVKELTTAALERF